LDSGFGSDGPDVVMVNHKAERPAPTTIHKVGQEQVEITVNNKQVEVNTIKAIADNGWQYWILDNARFPLMVKGDGPIRWDAPTIIVDETPEPTPKASKNEGKRIVNDLKKKGIATTRSILFDFDSAKLKPSAKPILNELIGYLKSDGKVGLSIEGHTDNVGGYDYNIKLSQRRANAVRDYLLKTGHVNLSRFKSKGYGYTKPVASNKTAAGRALNRRVVFVKL
jgi:outer membrane protein OmpA-like peptidoglycan-associated protein